MRAQKFISIAIIILLCAMVFFSIGIDEKSDENNFTPSQLMDHSTRSPFGVNVTGNVSDAQGYGTYMTWIAAFNFTSMQVVNTTVSWDGDYTMFLPEHSKYILLMFPINGKYQDGYQLHGYFPYGQDVETKDADVEVNFTLEPAYEIILEATNQTGGLISEENITGVKWVTDSSDTIATDGSEFGFWTGSSNGAGFTAPSVLIEPGTKRDIWLQWEEPGFGRINVEMDNASNGYGGPAGQAEVVNVNYDIARSLNSRLSSKVAEYELDGYSRSTTTDDHIYTSHNQIYWAGIATGQSRIDHSNNCTNATLWALEGLEMDKAIQDIEINRKGDLTINVKDNYGQPVEGAAVTINQTDRDFLIGAFEPIINSGREPWEQIKSIGCNYATAGFYWSNTEPTEGNFLFDEINNSLGVTDLHEMGFKIKAHALIYLIKYVVPEYLKTKNYEQLNQTIYDHVYTLVDTYKDKIDIWNVVNEASAEGANLNLTKEEMIHIIKTGVRAIRDADPDGQIIVNNAFFWFNEHTTGTFLYGPNEDNYSQPIHEFLDLLETENVDYDIVGQQMYSGGYSSIFIDAGLETQGLTASTFDFSTMSEIMDALEKYDKPVHITEQSVSGTWNHTSDWPGAGWWHNKWDAQTQADFLTQYYTLVFSKPKAEAVTWWGLSDSHAFMKEGTWFDENGDPKPIFYALKDWIANHTTNTVGVTDENGNVTFRGYGGEYNITVEHKGEVLTNHTHITEQTSQELALTFDKGWRADLMVLGDDIDITVGHPLEPDTIFGEITVHNPGSRAAKNVLVNGSWPVMNEPDIITYVTSFNTAPLIEAESSVTVNMTWNKTEVFGAKGHYNLEVTIDENDEILEMFENNNKATYPITTPYAFRVTVYDNQTGHIIKNVTIANATSQTEYPSGGYTEFTEVGWRELTAKKNGYVSQTKRIYLYPNRDTNLDFYLDPLPGSISGVIVNTTGSRVPNATIHLKEVNLTVSGGTTGEFEFTGLPYGNYTLNVTAEGFYPFEKIYTVEKNKTTSMFVVMMELPDPIQPIPDPEFSIIVFFWIENDHTGPIEGARISVDGNYLGNTDSNGKYTLEFNETETFNIKVEKENYETISLDLVVSESMNKHVQISMNLTVALYDGFVYDDYGQPVKNATVTFGNRTMKTDEFGYFDLGVVEFGDYELYIYADEMWDYQEFITITGPGKTRSTIYMEGYPETGDLEGLVVDEEGDPIPVATITIPTYGYERLSGPNGEFYIFDMDPGEYTVKVSKEGYITKEVKVYITAGETEKWTITLKEEAEPEEEQGPLVAFYAGMIVAILAILIVIIIVILALRKVEPPPEADKNARDAEQEEEEEEAPAETAEDGSLMAESVSDDDEQPDDQSPVMGKPPDEEELETKDQKQDMDFDLDDEPMEDEFDQDMLGDIEFDVDVEEIDDMDSDDMDW